MNISPYLSAFESFSKHSARKDPSWIQGVRKKAISRFSELGFPTVRQEEWKYTNVEPIARRTFHFSFDIGLNGLTLKKLETFLFGEANWTRLVFVNGFYSKGLSFFTPKGEGVKIGSLGEILKSEPALLEPYLAQIAPYENNPFTALNTAFIQDGAFILLPKGSILKEPVHLLFISLSTTDERVSQPRNLIIAERESRATVIESYVSLNPNHNFTNAVTEMVLEDGAALDHYKIQREDEQAFHISGIQVLVRRDSRFSSFSVATGAQLSRNTLNVELSSEGAECVLNGLYFVRGRQHVDNHTTINHAKPAGKSRQLYKGILDGHARGVFSGKIFVRKDAQKTDANQTNKNLLLSDHASVDTRPQLEIFADDVKCTHGAAVGQLDPEAIFYLKSRGMEEGQARNLLTYGFANEVIERIELEALRSELDRFVLSRLRNEFPTGAVS